MAEEAGQAIPVSVVTDSPPEGKEAPMRDKAPNEPDKRSEVFPADYLAAKVHIDDTALNMHVLMALARCLSMRDKAVPLQVLEVGGGIGSMLSRLMEREVLHGSVVYWLSDNDAAHLAGARRHLSHWAQEHGNQLIWDTEYTGRLVAGTADITIKLCEIDIRTLQQRKELRGCFDLLLAHGVLDLFDLPQVMGGLMGCLIPEGLCYFTCNFDGETVFIPELPADREIVRHYHGSMEKRVRGASHTGRRLLAYLRSQEAEILAAGSSDWLIHPGTDGYPRARKVFLRAIIALVENELAETAGNSALFADWVRLRRQQVEEEGLCFIAKHLDILARP